MGAFSIWHWLIVLIVALILFGGRGRISNIMADIGKGFRSFRNELDKSEEKSEDKKD